MKISDETFSIVKRNKQNVYKNVGEENKWFIDDIFREIEDKESNCLSVKRASEIEVKAIDWLWKDRIAKGKITMFAGEGGIGKSTLLLYLASLITTGGTFPVDKQVFQEGNVVILSAEDDAADTMVPRLKASKANLERIFFLEGTKKYDLDGNEFFSSITLDKDISKIDNMICRIGSVELLIIDPISAYLGEINDHSNSEVRVMLARLKKIAEKRNCSIILNTHLSKTNGASKSSASNRVMGSVAYVNASRSTYLISRDPEDPKNKRLFVPVKNNLAPDGTGFAYKIKPVISDGFESTTVEFFDEIVNETANEILDENASENKIAKQEAIEFLLDFLSTGCKSFNEIKRASEERMIARTTLKRAKDELNIVTEQSLSDKRKTVWFLPALSPSEKVSGKS